MRLRPTTSTRYLRAIAPLLASATLPLALVQCGLVQETDPAQQRDAAPKEDGRQDASLTQDASKADTSFDAKIDDAHDAAQPPAKITYVASGLAANCGVFSNGRVKCFGYGEFGAMGQGNPNHLGDNPSEVGNLVPWIDLGAGRIAVAVATRFTHTCARFVDGKVKCWGNDLIGAIGLGGSPTRRGDNPSQMGDALPDLPLGAAAVDVRVGGNSTCALLVTGQLKCWGEETAFDGVGGPYRIGAVSDPPIALGTGRTVKAFDVADSHACAILDNDRLKCWGFNGDGQLGLGDKVSRGGTPGEMGDALPYVDLGTGRTAKAIRVNDTFACAILDDDGVKCWGSNLVGELGIGRTDQYIGDGPNEMGDALPEVNLGTGLTAKAIGTGDLMHTCAILSNDQVKCWGRRLLGVATPDSSDIHGTDPSHMGDALPFMDLGTGRSAKSFSVGGTGVCVLLDNDRVKCWGGNGKGSLGVGDDIPRLNGPMWSGDAMPYTDWGG